MPTRESPSIRARNPWWIPPFLGTVPVGVEPRHLALLGILALAIFFADYDISLLTSVLKYLRQDFELSEAELGTFTGAIRLGTLPAFFLIPLADRIGRQRMFLISVIGLSVATFLTALSQTATQFVLFQIASRAFILAASATAFVIVTEEFPAEHRGWGIGILAAVGSIGSGLGALIFAGIEEIPFGWRGLYVIGFVPLLFLPRFRRRVPETRRFQLERGERLEGKSPARMLRGWLEPIAELGRKSPKYAVGVLLLGVLSVAGTATAFQMTAYYVLEVHGWAPWQYSTMFFLGGAVGVTGSPLAGRLGDLYGRRVLCLIVLLLFPAAAFTFYTGPAWSVPIGWICMVFMSMAAAVMVRALVNEVFPTSHRGTGGGLLSTVETLGAAGGLFLYALVQDLCQTQGLVVAMISLLTAASACTLLLFPETKGLELESIHGPSEDLE